jgi:hypothetical protein
VQLMELLKNLVTRKALPVVSERDEEGREERGIRRGEVQGEDKGRGEAVSVSDSCSFAARMCE